MIDGGSSQCHVLVEVGDARRPRRTNKLPSSSVRPPAAEAGASSGAAVAMVVPLVGENPTGPVAGVLMRTAGKLPFATTVGVLMAIVPEGSSKNMSA